MVQACLFLPGGSAGDSELRAVTLDHDSGVKDVSYLSQKVHVANRLFDELQGTC